LRRFAADELSGCISFRYPGEFDLLFLDVQSNAVIA